MGMKLAIILAALAAAMGTWRWITYQNRTKGKQTFAQYAKKAFHSVLAGIVVYFCLLLVGLAYLALVKG